MRYARVPTVSATSTRRLALELLVAPMTRTTSTSPAMFLTAAWRFWVA